MKKCSFTGHRVIASAHMDTVREKLKSGVEYAYTQGCRDFLCGGALGFDTMAAEAVINFRASHAEARLVLVLPCRDQANGWSDSDREKYEHILSVADEIIYIRDIYVDGCMKERNQYLADECDMLICYLNSPRSGAGQTVRMAKSLNKPVYNICPNKR